MGEHLNKCSSGYDMAMNPSNYHCETTRLSPDLSQDFSFLPKPLIRSHTHRIFSHSTITGSFCFVFLFPYCSFSYFIYSFSNFFHCSFKANISWDLSQDQYRVSGSIFIYLMILYLFIFLLVLRFKYLFHFC